MTIQTNNTTEAPGLKVTPIGREPTREILRPKFKANDHWIIVCHGAAMPLITTIEQKYYLDEKNSDFTLITSFWSGQHYTLSAARKKHLRRYQLGSLLRQMIGLKISDAEMSARDLYIFEGPDPLPEDAAQEAGVQPETVRK